MKEIERRDGIGAAIDVGSTNLSARLVSLASGETVAEKIVPNPTRAWGADVVRRLGEAALPGKAAAMARSFRERIGILVSEMAESAGYFPREAAEIVAVGNSAMHSLFWELPAESLARAPFEPANAASREASCRELGMPGLSEARIYWPPLIGGYIGSDALCALDAALAAPGAQLPFLLVDTGTNSEILLATRGRILCASAAAGPALEGGNMSCGMAAGKGAIHAFHLERGRLVPSVIGESMPMGICGSGIVDLVALLLEMGGIDASGTLCPEGAPPAILERCERQGRTKAFALLPGFCPLSQPDVRALQLAKGAIAAAESILLEEAGLRASDLEDVLLAGAFGTALDPQNAVRIGLVPKTRTRARGVGNAALEGAAQYLAAPVAARERHKEILERAVHVPLHADPRFQETFIASLSITPWA
jgi:uncharacterized 2Fe-2S/4Fe-4S cluster protein (DUF4445 family)